MLTRATDTKRRLAGEEDRGGEEEDVIGCQVLLKEKFRNSRILDSFVKVWCIRN